MRAETEVTVSDIGRQAVPLWKALAAIVCVSSAVWAASSLHYGALDEIDSKLARKAEVSDVVELKTTITSLTAAVNSLNVSVARLETRLNAR